MCKEFQLLVIFIHNLVSEKCMILSIFLLFILVWFTNLQLWELYNCIFIIHILQLTFFFLFFLLPLTLIFDCETLTALCSTQFHVGMALFVIYPFPSVLFK